MSTNLYNATIHDVAKCYMRESFGLSYAPEFTDISLDQAKRIADSFVSQAQYTPDTLAAYDLFIRELMFQWDYVVKAGLCVQPWTQTTGQPYKNSRELFNDVKDNNHMYFYLTTSGFGNETNAENEHPMLNKSGVILNGIELCYNDIFRVVHDYFGHCIYGFQFGLKGETNAWQSHLAMFVSQGARLALSNEAQGQTSWFQAGSHLRRADGSLPARGDADFIPLQERPFAEQRVQIIPAHIFYGLAYV